MIAPNILRLYMAGTLASVCGFVHDDVGWDGGRFGVKRVANLIGQFYNNCG